MSRRMFCIVRGQTCIFSGGQIELNLSCVRWGFLSRAGLWDKSHLMRQVEKYELVPLKYHHILSNRNLCHMFHKSHCSPCRYADIYTSRVSNFLHYTPFMYFRSQEQVLEKHILCIHVASYLNLNSVVSLETDLCVFPLQTLAHDSYAYYSSNFNGSPVGGDQ